MTISRRGYALGLVLIFAVAFALRIGVTAQFIGLDSLPDKEAAPDQVDYESYAHQLSIGNGYVEDDGTTPGIRRSPGASFTLLPAYLLFGRSFFWGRVWLCLLSAATCVLTGWIGRHAFGRLVGLVAASWMAFYPGIFYFAMHFMSETPFAFWLAAALGFTMEAIKKRCYKADLIAGLCWGMAVLTRPGTLLLAPIAGAIVLLNSNARREHLRRLVMHGAMVGICLAPWVVRNMMEFGKPTISTVGGHTFYGANNDIVLHRHPQLAGKWIPTSILHKEYPDRPIRGTEMEREKAAWKYGREFVSRNWGSMPYLTVMKLYRLVKPVHDTPNRIIYWTFTVSWLFVVPFLLIGLVAGWRRNRTATLLLLIPMVALVMQTVIFYGIGRFRDARSPAFLPLAALGLWVALSRLFPSMANAYEEIIAGPGDQRDPTPKTADAVP